MRVAIPHSLDNDTVRERLKSKSHQIGDSIPGGANVRTMWPTEDRMTMDIGAMGQNLHAQVDLEPGQRRALGIGQRHGVAGAEAGGRRLRTYGDAGDRHGTEQRQLEVVELGWGRRQVRERGDVGEGRAGGGRGHRRTP